MRITFLTHYPGLYGANRSLLDLMDGLRTYGVEATVIAPREGEIAGELQKRNIEARFCELGRCVSAIPKDYRSRRPVQRLSQRLRSLAGRIKENRRALPPVIRQLKEWRTEVVYSNSSFLLSGLLAARALQIPHVWHLREFGDLDYGFAPDLGRRGQKWLIDQSSGIIAVSASIRDYYQLDYPSRIRVVNSGIAWASDFHRYRHERYEAAGVPRDYTFALVGLLHPAKGQVAAIHALHRVVESGKKANLIIVGSGPADYGRQLEELVAACGLQSRVVFRGYTEDVYSIYKSADAALMCSTHEAMGRVTAEAMAAGLPVIGYRSGGTEEIIEHEETGLLYEDGCSGLAACMLRFVEQPEWARQLGENGWKRARDRFTIERYAANVHDVLRSVHSFGTAARASAPSRRTYAEDESACRSYSSA